jgi:NAD-dependent DNA ligase
MTQNLIQFLDKASRAYYNGEPFIRDEQFDILADSCDYKAVGARASGNTGKHYKQLYSLQKHYEGENKRPLEGERDVSPSLKLDGAAVSLLYIDGELVRGLTRGDGIEGQDITSKLLSTKNIVPHSINDRGVRQITGEICAPKHIENARNYAAGALNLKDDSEFATRALTFFAYGVYPYFTETYDGDVAKLAKLGFNTVKEPGLENIYPSDGMVFRVNSNARFDELGYTAKFPRGAYALKTRAEHVETKLLAVEWNTGRTGRVTPVAILEPVLIEDAWVSRATLNNPEFIEQLDLRIGDTVAVIRSGSVIPCILHRVE